MKISKNFSNLLCIFLCILFAKADVSAQIQFIENKGQWDSQVKYMTTAGDGAFFLTQNGYTISQYNPADIKNIKESRHAHSTQKSTSSKTDLIRSHSYNVAFLNASTTQIVPEKPIATYNNYFIGDDKSKWVTGCKIYQVVKYENLYPGIDVRYYVDGGNNLKYDFIIHPGADVDDIAMKYSGTKDIKVKNRELKITTSLGTSKELRPYTYQVVNNKRQEVECSYEIKGDVVKFKIKNYSPDKILVIDPTLIFFSYAGSTSDNWGFTATYGPDGSFFGGGIVFAPGFPTSPGSYDQTFSGTFDMAIMKLSPDGRNRMYATYIGGSKEEQPHSLIVDGAGNLVLAGRSNSPDYPVQPARDENESGKGGAWDIVVTKLNASGSSIIGSMRIGGTGNDGVNIADENAPRRKSSLKRNYGDDSRSEVILDGANNIYVASSSQTSDNGFPTTPGAFQRVNAGKQDGVVLKLNPNCTNIIFSTLFGGTGDDAGYVLNLGNSNNIYVAGGTGSPDLSGISPSGVVKPTYSVGSGSGDDCDGYILEFNNSGTAVLKGTYMGTGKADQIYGIATDKNGFIYIMGTSEGNMPVINAVYSNAGAKQFISKLQPDLSAFVYSTVFGSPNSPVPNISPTAFLVDRCENVYVSGWGGKSNAGFSSGNTKGMPVTPGAIKSVTDASGSDFYFFVMKKDAASQLYGTFFGQDDPPEGVTEPLTFGDHVDGGTSRFDRNGIIYQAICANCFKSVPFPGTPGSWSPTNQAVGDNGKCNMGMLKIEMNFTGVRSGIKSSIDGVINDTIGCIPLQVDFKDTVLLGKLYYWDFGDGTGDTTINAENSHLYSNVGTYRVRLIAIDSTTCNISDTSYLTIKAGSNKANLDFIANKLQPCTSLGYSFTNTSTAGIPFSPNTFTWDFGDNSPTVTQGFSPPVTHTYAAPGTYNVTLTINDDTFCNSPGDTTKLVRLSPQVTAIFSTPAAGCAPYDAVFKNESLGGLNFEWNFGDGTTSTEVEPTHTYPNPGTYTITLKAFDSTSCNKVDETSFTINVSSVPVASFTYNPLQPQENTPTNFSNQSTNANSYLWDFGDGDTSIAVNPSHQFGASATNTVCLTAFNAAGCADDTCVEVESIIRPLLDVPTAFTPGTPGANSRIRVEGFGISEMKWSIYNRWGEMVFESNNRKQSWDGTYKGKLQPLDVYTYTLEVKFSDGTKARKTGDITLLR